MIKFLKYTINNLMNMNLLAIIFTFFLWKMINAKTNLSHIYNSNIDRQYAV